MLRINRKTLVIVDSTPKTYRDLSREFGYDFFHYIRWSVRFKASTVKMG